MIDIQNDFIEDTEHLVQKITKRKAVIVVDAQIDFIWGVLGTKEAQAALSYKEAEDHLSMLAGG